MKNSLSDRIKVTKNKKVLRRKMAVNHFRSKKRASAKTKKKKMVSLGYPNIESYGHTK